MTLREQLDTNDKHTESLGPTKARTERNTHALHCRSCGDLWFVDDATYERAKAAIAYDPAENPFSCARCEEEYADFERE
jgi:hypothetical protein